MKATPTPLSDEGQELFAAALRILPGLLASGHFTYPAEDDDDAGLQLDDLGEEWYEYAMSKRPPTAIGCALTLVEALADACWCDTAHEHDQRRYFDEKVARMELLKKRKVAQPTTAP